MTDHQACVISDFLRISYHRSKKLTYPLGQIDYNRFEIGYLPRLKREKGQKLKQLHRTGEKEV